MNKGSSLTGEYLLNNVFECIGKKVLFSDTLRENCTGIKINFCILILGQNLGFMRKINILNSLGISKKY